MEWLTLLYYFYTFFAMYFIILFVFVFLKNGKKYMNDPKYTKVKSLSVVVPCYNEEKTIAKTIERLLKSDYPGLQKIVVVDDCSKDNSFNIIKECEKKYKGKVLALRTPKNTGKAAGSKNYGAKFVDTELIGFSDADSTCKKNAISYMIGYLEDEEVGCVTSRVYVDNCNNSLERMQSIEYKTIAFMRKTMEFIDSIYVANGPLSIYKKDVFDKVGGFDEKNLTEDIELTWHIVRAGYKVKMSLNAIVYTEAPSKLRVWFKQRVRWNVGGFQTTKKYLKERKQIGVLGKFIVPYFIASWLIGVSGLFILVYRGIRYIIVKVLTTKMAIESQIELITLKDLMISPTILLFLGIFLFMIGTAFFLYSIVYCKEKEVHYNILEIFLYSFIYVMLYPPILITSLIKYCKGYDTW